MPPIHARVQSLTETAPAFARSSVAPAAEFKRAFFRRAAAAAPSGAAADAAGRRTTKMARLEAALFVAGGALSARRLAQVATLADAAEARGLVEALNSAYDADGSAFRVERVAGGYQLLTRPEYARWLDRLHDRPARTKLSPPALETLTIIAYRQPVTRADIEAIRGVQSAEIIKQLMERGLVRIAGEEDSLGRPYLYETTRTFLEQYGLRSLDDLPSAEELRRSANDEDSAGQNEPAETADTPAGGGPEPQAVASSAS
jgi:segregation and condensation protein B